MRIEERVLVLAPVGRDAPLVGHVLGRAHLDTRLCRDAEDLSAEIQRGAGAVILTEEACIARGSSSLAEALAVQEPWSDLPLVVLTGGRPASRTGLEVLQALERRPSVTFLERPVRLMSLVSAVRAAVQSRRRQYEVRDLIGRLVERLDRRDQFLAMLGHEIRNPLAAMEGGIALLAQGNLRPEDDVWARGMVRQQLTRLTRLINDLLEMSRISRGKLQLRREGSDLAQIVAAAVDTVGPLMEEKGHALAAVVDPPSIPIDVDPTRIEQVLVNLLTNAARYTPRGGHVRIEARAEGAEVVIRVTDDGLGIEREDLERIFEPFSQTAAGRGTGLGIGLTLVRQLVELHNGSVDASSEGPRKGSTFTVRLPRIGVRPAAPAQPRPATVAPQPVAARVLVIDDNADAARGLALQLGYAGCSARIATTGRGGIAAAYEFRPQVTVVDIGLPDIDGFQVAAKLREAPELARTTLIALTGFGSNEMRERMAASATFDHYMLKPADVERLLEIVEGRSRAPTGAAVRS